MSAALCIPVVQGCSEAAEEASAEEDLGASSVRRETEALKGELRLLTGSAADATTLVQKLEVDLEDQKQKKDAAKSQAERDVADYDADAWDASWYTQAEREDAAAARAKDLFGRSSRRKLEGTKIKLGYAKHVAEIKAEPGRADAQAEADLVYEAYADVGAAIILNRKLGLMRQGVVLVFRVETSPIELGIPALDDAVRRNRIAAGAGAGRLADPKASSLWRPRSSDEVTPRRLHDGPWYDRRPALPLGETIWQLDGFKARDSDGAHGSVNLKSGDEEIKLKLSNDAEAAFMPEPARARLLWALGYETDPQELLTDIRMEPRAYLAGVASAGRVLDSDNLGPEVLPGRPKGGGIPLHGFRDSPGPGFVSVHYLDGRDEGGKAAIRSLENAMDDRALRDTMAFVTVHRAYAERDPGEKREGIGPWHPDASNHIEDRELRALKIIFNGWLGSNDFKFNNLRLDVAKASGAMPFNYYLTVSDVGGGPRDIKWGIDTSNMFRIEAFERMGRDSRSFEDSAWAVTKIAALSEEQILACVATGAFTPEATALHTEVFIARRDALVKEFRLEGEFPLLRPGGPNKNPHPRTYRAP